MTAEQYGQLSGFIVGLSGIPYAIRAYQRQVHPNPVSWGLWTLISFTLLVTYQTAATGANVYPAILGFINPLIISIIAWRRSSTRESLTRRDYGCIALSIVSLGIWFAVRKVPEHAALSLYLAIFADAGAAIPTILYVWKTPEGDRPFAWALFSIGYATALLAVQEHTVAAWALPVYMTVGPMSIAWPLIRYRIKNRIALREWM